MSEKEKRKKKCKCPIWLEKWMVDLTAGASISDGTELLEIPTTLLKSGSSLLVREPWAPTEP